MTTPTDRTADPETVAASFCASIAIFEAMGAHLFAEFCRHAADDPFTLALAGGAMEGARPAHLFSAVHYLLLGDPSDPLARWFATIVDDPLPPAGSWPELSRFVRAHADELAGLLRTRSVQTTYAERCRAILPPMALVAREAEREMEGPLNLIEIGCSAGVLLVFDKFAYRLNAQGTVGDPAAPLVLTGELRGEADLFVPRIGTRTGIDLHTLDARSPEDRRWLLALCFPELRDEQRRLALALDTIAATPMALLEGDGLAMLAQAMAQTPDPLCIFHSACLFYWPREARAALEAALVEASRGRTFWRIGIEPSDAFDDWQRGEGGSAAAAIPGGKRSGEIRVAKYAGGAATSRSVGQPNPDYGIIDWTG